MVDVVNDYRGVTNRYKIRKHNILKKENEFYRIKRKTCSSSRTPARSRMKNICVVRSKTLDSEDDWFFGDTTDKLDYTLDPVFVTNEDCLAFQLHDLIKTNDIDRIETLLLYSAPGLFEKSINMCGRPVGCIHPIESPLMAAARLGNDRLVCMFLNTCSTVDINLTIDVNQELKRDKTYRYTIEGARFLQSSDKILKQLHPWSCQLPYCHIAFDWGYGGYSFHACQCCINGFGRTALWFACFHGHLNVVRTLTEIGNANIHISDSKYWTPLRAAIFQKHIDIVQYLIEQSNAIIDETRDFFIAIRSGNYDIIDYLLDKGCDPNTRLMDENMIYESDNYTRFALHYIIDDRSANLSIVKTLLKHGSDPTIKDNNGETALHIAIRRQNKEIIQEILHYGFKHPQRNENNLTPLMLAMIMNLPDVIELFYEILPRQQYIDEIMLLAAFCTLEYRFNFTQIDPRAFIYFEQGLKFQESNSNILPNDLYKFRQECQTVDELIIIEFNFELMFIQALLVYERLLPQRNEVSLLIPKLFDFYQYYFEIQDYEQCLIILIHLYPKILSCKENIFYVWDKFCLNNFVDLLGLLIENEMITYIDYILQAFKWTLQQLYISNQQIFRLCLYIAYLIELDQIDYDKKRQLISWLTKAIHQNYVLTSNMNIFFQQAIETCLYNIEPFFHWISHKQFLDLLIYCGTDVNGGCKYRPLHQVALLSDNEYTQSIIEVLIAAGTHTDYLDYQSLLPEERSLNIKIRNYLHMKRSRSLKCQCVQLIISEKIPYQSYLSDHLKTFILMHQTR